MRVLNAILLVTYLASTIYIGYLAVVILGTSSTIVVSILTVLACMGIILLYKRVERNRIEKLGVKHEVSNE